MKRLICGTIKLKQLLVVFIFLSISGQLSAQTITISTGGETGTSGTNWSTSGTNPVTISASGDATINTSVVQDYLNSGLSVIVNATSDIILSGAISKTSGNSSLTFNAGRDIFIQAAINSTGSALPVTFNADSNNDNFGAIMLSSGLSTNGGAIDFQDDLTFKGTAAQTVNSGVATITFEGEVMLSNTNGITLTTNDSNINFSKAVETKLSPTPLTINAGAGTVTFSGAVGASNPLKTLTVTAATTAINGGSVTTNADGTHGGSGTQSYSGNITLGSASTTLSMLDTPTDFTLNSGKTITNQSGGDAALTIKTTAGIITGANSIISSSTGKLNTILWADTDANGGGIFVNAGASITSNGGDVTLSGGTDYTTGYARGTSATVWSGVRIDGSINSGTGSVLLRGQIGDIPANQNTLSPGGVFIVPSGSITATSGNITLAGYVSSNVGTGNALRAIRLGDGIASVGQASITTTSGNISLTGTTAPTYAGAGILFDSSKIQSGSGSITLTGQRGGGEPDLLFNSGTILKNISNQISSTTGNITMNANSLEVWGEGDLYTRLPISSAGQLTIQPRTAGTTIGLSGGTGSLSLPASLFSTSFNNGFSSITIGHSTAGNITVGGALSYNDPLTVLTAGNIVINANLTTTASNTGIYFKAGGSISQAASVGVTTNGGHVVLWADTDSNGGPVLLNSGSAISTNGGHIWIGGGEPSISWNGLTVGIGYALGNNVAGERDGILINNGTLNSAGGDIALYGESCVVTGASDLAAGIRINDQLNPNGNTVINSGTGKIVFEGVGRGSTGYFSGVEINTANASSTVTVTSANTTAAAITIIGNASPATASGWGLLSYYNTEFSATGTGGGVTITGKISSSGGRAIGFSSPSQTGTRVLANGGPIVFNAITNGAGNSIYALGNNMVVGQLAGSAVPTSSSDITLNIDLPMTGSTTNVPDLTFSSSGSLAIQPLTATTTIGIAGATGTVQLPASLFSTNFADGFNQIKIGSGTQSGNINLKSVSFRDNMRLQTTGTVSINAGQTITATGIKLQTDNTLGMEAESKIIR